jgi:arylsulfatase
MQRSQLMSGIAAMALACALGVGGQAASQTPGSSAASGEPFAGVIGRTLEESTPAWPEQPRPPQGAPNILVWMLDDVGFGQLGAFGGLVETPNLDRIAQEGLRFANFHATPICSASRAAFLTGRNSHRVHMGGHAIAPFGFPGYDARVPPEAGTIADALHEAGYITYALGKWDHLPSQDMSASGPFDLWPSGQGFDRFYGFLSADTDNFQPVLWSDHTPIEIPADAAGYNLSQDLADHAIAWIDERGDARGRRPFFMYWAPSAAHSPHHAPAEMIAHYRGRFAMGWDRARAQILQRQIALGVVPASTRLPPRPDGMPAWDSLTQDERRSFARAMEAFAGYLTYADQQFGRIIDHLRETGELDNTLIVIVSDNGASAEGGPGGTFNEFTPANGHNPDARENLRYLDVWGGPETYPHYPIGWAAAGNTPFRYYKQTAFEGGVRVPMIISWPRGIEARGEVREQFHFITDLAPTLLAAAGVAAPAEVDGAPQLPFDGVDMSYALANSEVPSARHAQYFEMYGNRAIWADGWKAVNAHRTTVWDLQSRPPQIRDDNWELYHVDEDVNELNNLARAEPQRLRDMLALFDREARANNVYPLTPSAAAGLAASAAHNQSAVRARGGLYIYQGPVRRIAEAAAPPLLARSFSADARVRLDETEASGPLFALGGRHGGVALFLSEGRPAFTFVNVDHTTTRIVAPEALGAGDARIGLDFIRRGGGARVVLRVNDEAVGQADIAGPLPRILSISETFDVGSDSGTPVAADYAGAPRFPGQIEDLRIQIRE